MIPLVENKLPQLAPLCERYRVKRLELFGSAAKGTFREADSDLDFLVEFDDRDVPGYAMRYLNFAEDLETMFGRKVDLLTIESVKNPYLREELAETCVNLYGTRSKETAV